MTTDYPCSIKGSFLKKKQRMGRISRGGLDKAKEIGRDKKKKKIG
jgi:hypothetical protein